MRVIFALHVFSFTFREAKYIVPKAYRIRRIYRARKASISRAAHGAIPDKLYFYCN